MTAKLTALRRARPGTVLLEVDGEPWRTVPDDVVVRCRLAAGVELERPLLRLLRRELRHAEALELAGRTLRRRDLSRRRLSERLEQAGVAPAAERSALAALTEARIVSLPTGHWPMLSEPKALAAILDELGGTGLSSP